jgi:hypothetical protein
LPQWLYAGPKEAGFSAELLETRHVRDAFKAMPVKTDCKDTRGILRGFGLKVGRTTKAGFARRIMELTEHHPVLSAIAEALLAVHAVLLRELDGFESQVRKLVKSDSRVRLLMTAPGVGPIVGETYVAAIDDPSTPRTAPPALVALRTALTAPCARHLSELRPGQRNGSQPNRETFCSLLRCERRGIRRFSGKIDTPSRSGVPAGTMDWVRPQLLQEVLGLKPGNPAHLRLDRPFPLQTPSGGSPALPRTEAWPRQWVRRKKGLTPRGPLQKQKFLGT